MTNTLVVDTSFGSTVGIVGHEPIVETDSRTHVERLQANIARVVADAGLTAQQIDRIVVGVGPAPFTGLRAGIVTAKALAFATGAELIGTDVLSPQHRLMQLVRSGRFEPACGMATGDCDAGVESAHDSDSTVAASDGFEHDELKPDRFNQGDASREGDVRHLTLAVNDARRRQLYFALYADTDDGSADSTDDTGVVADATVIDNVDTVAVDAAGATAIDTPDADTADMEHIEGFKTSVPGSNTDQSTAQTAVLQSAQRNAGVNGIIAMDIDYPAHIADRVNQAVARLQSEHPGTRYVVDVAGHGARRYADAWNAIDRLGDVDERTLLDMGGDGLAAFAQFATEANAAGQALAIEPLYLRRPDVSVPKPLKQVLNHAPVQQSTPSQSRTASPATPEASTPSAPANTEPDRTSTGKAAA